MQIRNINNYDIEDLRMVFKEKYPNNQCEISENTLKIIFNEKLFEIIILGDNIINIEKNTNKVNKLIIISALIIGVITSVFINILSNISFSETIVSAILVGLSIVIIYSFLRQPLMPKEDKIFKKEIAKLYSLLKEGYAYNNDNEIVKLISQEEYEDVSSYFNFISFMMEHLNVTSFDKNNFEIPNEEKYLKAFYSKFVGNVSYLSKIDYKKGSGTGDASFYSLNSNNEITTISFARFPHKTLKPIIEFMKPLKKLDTLIFSLGNIENIDLLSEFPDLKELFFSMTLIKDYSPLATLSKLETLSISMEQNFDIRIINRIKSLKNLSLNLTSISDINYILEKENWNYLQIDDDVSKTIPKHFTEKFKKILFEHSSEIHEKTLVLQNGISII